MVQTVTQAAATPKMQMSPERAHEVILMTQKVRQNFPELKAVSDDHLLYATWRSFKRIDQTSDSDYHTMAHVFFREFDRHLLNYQFSKAGEDASVQHRFLRNSNRPISIKTLKSHPQNGLWGFCLTGNSGYTKGIEFLE